MTEHTRHLYVHIPFCARICPYCAFYKDLIDRAQTNRFCEAILRELEQHATNFQIAATTIYFGGGTPSLFGPERIGEILDRIKTRSAECEITIEANPGTAS